MRIISSEEFEIKYYLYKKMIYNIAYSYVKNSTDSDDITQDVFMKYLKSNEQFKTLDNEKYWLIRVAINTSKTFLTSSWNKKVIKDDEIVNLQETEVEKEDKSLFDSVCKLKSKYKEVIILYYYENLSVNEISEALKISSENVRKRLERARKLLREMEVEKNG